MEARPGGFLNSSIAPTCVVPAGDSISSHERSRGGIGLVMPLSYGRPGIRMYGDVLSAESRRGGHYDPGIAAGSPSAANRKVKCTRGLQPGAGFAAGQGLVDRDQDDCDGDADKEWNPGDPTVGIVVVEEVGDYPRADQAAQGAEYNRHDHADVLSARHDETRHQTDDRAHDEGENY